MRRLDQTVAQAMFAQLAEKNVKSEDVQAAISRLSLDGNRKGSTSNEFLNIHAARVARTENHPNSNEYIYPPGKNVHQY